MAVGDAHVFPGFLTPVLTQPFFPKPPTTFLTCFCRGERQKYAGKKVRLNRGSNSQPPGHESDTLTTEPPGRGIYFKVRSIKFYLNRKLMTDPIYFDCNVYCYVHTQLLLALYMCVFIFGFPCGYF